MKKFLLIIILHLIAGAAFAQSTCHSVQNGSWNDASTWSCGVIPVSGYTTIEISHKVTVPNGGSTGSGNLIVKNGAELELIGQLNMGTNESTCNSNLTVEQGGLVSADSNGQNERLRLCGTVVLTGQQSGNIAPAQSIPPGGYEGPATFTRTGMGTLPVELLFFEGKMNGNGIYLKWATAYEDNFDFFTVQRSHDAINFEDIATVHGAGFSTGIKNYSFNDESSLKGRLYYRLKATDYDGTVEYHKIIAVMAEPAAQASIYPNPLSGNDFKLISNLKPEANSRIRIFNIVGHEVYQAVLSDAISEHHLAKTLDRGLYIVIVENGTRKIQSKLTVK